MSIQMQFLFPDEDAGFGKEWRIKNILTVDQDYRFFGHIIQMSKERIDDDPEIPDHSLLQTVEMTSLHTIILPTGERNIPEVQQFYICRASEYQKIPVLKDITYWNQALIKLLRTLKPEAFVIIKMSW